MASALPKDVWVFKAPTEFTLVLSGSKREVQRTATGDIVQQPGGPSLKVVFKHGLLVIDDNLASGMGMKKDDLAALVMKERPYNRRFFLAQSPKMVLDKKEKEELAEKVEASRKTHGPKVNTGVRGRNN